MKEEDKTLTKEELMELTHIAGSPLSVLFHMGMSTFIQDGISSQDVLRIGQAVLSILTCSFIDFIFEKYAPLDEKKLFCDMLNEGMKECLTKKQFMCDGTDSKH